MAFGRSLADHPAALCNMLRRVALEAGDATLAYFEEAGFTGAQDKPDGSPVTEADRAAEKIILAALSDLTPGVPVITEEAFSAGDRPDLSAHENFWLVDPIDGTKEFIAGRPDYTVNIAFVRKGEPALGVIYAPVPGELYAGYTGPGGESRAIRFNDDNETEKEIRTRAAPGSGLTVVASRNHGDDALLNRFLENHKVEKLLKRGSSIKLCAIASGRADLYPRFGETSEWGIAAGDAILRAAGGALCDLHGRKITYGKAEAAFKNPPFIACSGDVLEMMDFPEISGLIAARTGARRD
jgi:3'(2'), 5'-bisphosphate nucleotidase